MLHRLLKRKGKTIIIVYIYMISDEYTPRERERKAAVFYSPLKRPKYTARPRLSRKKREAFVYAVS